jgi:ABC-type spermidine/putrescine transport system permease subunit II
VNPNRTGRWLAGLAGTAALLLLLAPLAVAIWMSFAPGELLEPPTGRWSLRWYARLLVDSRWRGALWHSLEVAALSAALATLCGTGLATVLSRAHFRGRRLLAGAALLPLFIPAVALGMGLLPLMYLLGLAGTRLGLAAAHALASLPVVYLVVGSALREVSPDLERAARGLGAGPVRAFRRVTWPLIRPAVAAAALFSFILSFNEFALALFLASPPEGETLPRVIWPELRYSLSPLVAAASAVSVSLAVVALALTAVLRRFTRYVRGRSSS